MKYIYFTIFLIIYISSSIFAQQNTFEKDLQNNDMFFNINVSSDNFFLISSYDKLICLDSSGNNSWSYNLPINGSYPSTFTNDFQDGSFALITQKATSYSSQIIALKNGAELWKKDFKLQSGFLDFPRSSSFKNDTLLVLSNSTKYAPEQYIPYLIKLAKNGDSIYVKQIPNTLSNEIGRDVFMENDTIIVITQFSSTVFYLLKLDKEANFISRTLLPVSGYILQSIRTTDECLTFLGTNDNTPETKITKVNLKGDFKSSISLGAIYPTKMAATLDKGFLIGLDKANSLGWKDIDMIKIDSLGNIQWEKKLGGRYDDSFKNVIELTDGGYAILGSVQITEYSNSITNYLFKVDSDGIIGGSTFTYKSISIPYYYGNANWGDVDGDNDPDAFIYGHLFENSNGNLTEVYPNDFTNTTHGYSYYPSGISAWGDIDNYNGLDLFSCGKDEVYLNKSNKKFKWDSTAFKENEIPTSFAPEWIDFNNDGYLDIFLANSYYNISTSHILYQNLGNNSFKKVNIINFPTNQYPLKHSWVDYDNDNDLDLLLFNLDMPLGSTACYNLCYRNNGDGTFTDISTSFSLYLAEPQIGKIAWGDIDNDKDMDAFTISSGTLSIYHNDGVGVFTKSATLIYSDADDVYLVDYDNDGYLDYYVNVDRVGLLFRNVGLNKFSRNIQFLDNAGLPNFLDYDIDGDIDFLSNSNGYNLSTNDGNSNKWVKIKLKGVKSNASGIGAQISVKIKTGNKEIWFSKQVISSVINDNLNSPVHFGIGKAAIIDSIIIQWPSGCKQYLKNTSVNTIVEVIENCFAQSPVPIDTFVCDDKSISLTPSISSTFNWYTSLDATTPVFIGNTFTISDLEKDTILFVANADSLTESRRSPIFIYKHQTPKAKFGYSMQSYYNQYYYQFIDSSLYADSRLWVFEDGTTSTLTNPVLATYQPVSFSVKLIVSSTCGIDSLTKQVGISSSRELFQIVGNPISENSYFKFYIDQSSYVKLDILDNLGEEVITLINSQLPMGEYKENLFNSISTQLKTGIYTGRLIINGSPHMIKIVKLN